MNISQLSAGPAGADGCGDINLLDKRHDPSRSLLSFLKRPGRESRVTWASSGSVPGFSRCPCRAFPSVRAGLFPVPVPGFSRCPSWAFPGALAGLFPVPGFSRCPCQAFPSACAGFSQVTAKGLQAEDAQDD